MGFIRFFRSSFFIQYFAIALTGIVLWLPAFFHPPQLPLPEGPVILYKLVYKLFSGFPLMAVIFAFLLLWWNTYFILNLFNNNDLIPKNSSLSAMIFMVLNSTFPQQLTLTPTLLALSLILLVLHHLLITYNKPEHFDRVFATGFFTAIAALFYLPALPWFFLVLISFVLFRSGRWREWMAATIGLFTPFLYLAVFLFWNNEFLTTFDQFTTFFKQKLTLPVTIGPEILVPSAIILLLLFWSMAKNRSGGKEGKVEIRIKYNLFLWVLFFFALSFFISHSLMAYHMAIATPSITLILTTALTGLKKHRLVEILLGILFMWLLINNVVINFILQTG